MEIPYIDCCQVTPEEHVQCDECKVKHVNSFHSRKQLFMAIRIFALEKVKVKVYHKSDKYKKKKN